MSKQLPAFQFIAELVHGWRQCLARGEDLGHYRPRDIDAVAATLRADFVRLPILRLLSLDPIRTYTNNSEFFRWVQEFCSKCQNQNDCSLLAATAKTMPAFEKYCSNASIIYKRMGALTRTAA